MRSIPPSLIHIRNLALGLVLSSISTAAFALTAQESRHLLVRTGFGADPAEIALLAPLTREQAIDQILASARDHTHLAPPEFCQNSLSDYLTKRKTEWKAAYALPPHEREVATNKLRARDYRHAAELRSWWLQEMITTDSPLTERMTLFWHNHFTSSLEVVEDPRLMYEQNALLRKHSTENFGHFCLAIPTDPAMFIYLDSNSNVAGRPNENFAREVMELFTVGEGHYSENDIKEAARAFTGYKMDDKTGTAELMPAYHDSGWKTVLGHEGNFDGSQIITVLLLQEQSVALHIADKFWKEFVDERGPQTAKDKAALYQVAKTFYLSSRGRYDIKSALKALFMQDQFWDPANYGTMTKGPIDYLVGTIRSLNLPVHDTARLAELSKLLGQDLFDPPNVKGWKGGTSWISTQSLLSRWEVMRDILNGQLSQDKDTTTFAAAGDSMMGGGAMGGAPAKGVKATKVSNARTPIIAPRKTDAKKEAKPVLALAPVPWLDQARKNGSKGIELAESVLLAIPPIHKIPSGNLDQAIHEMLLDPVYNLE